MTARQQRRAQQKAERKAQKIELRNNGISEAKLTANRENSKLSTGPVSTIGKQIASQNRTRHGLTGQFRVMPDESQANFDLLLDCLLNEHAPADQTEVEFVQLMAEALWLSHRSLRFQSAALLAFESGDEQTKKAARKDLALFLRYQTTHDRAFVRYSTELRKRRNERRRAERGFESQTYRATQETRKHEAHQMRQAIEKRRQERHEVTLSVAQAKLERKQQRETHTEAPKEMAAAA